jgi:S-adenosylmethionine-diacylgycerolhomoserine-N-methlytransferase
MTIESAAQKMDRIYRYQRGIYDLTRRYYLLGRATLIADLAPPPTGTILEVGCGTASNLIAAARAYPGARLYGLDVSTEMLATAKQAVARRSLENRIHLASADATTFDGQSVFNVGAFDRIFASYMLSMVPQWPRVIDAMIRNLADGGSIHIVDFGDCERLPTWFRKTLYRWLGAFHVTPRQDLHEQLKDYAGQHRLELTHTPLWRGYAHYAVLSRVDC